MEIVTTKWPGLTLAYAPDIGDHGGFVVRADDELIALAVGPELRESYRMAFEIACELVGMVCLPDTEEMAWTCAANKLQEVSCEEHSTAEYPTEAWKNRLN